VPSSTPSKRRNGTRSWHAKAFWVAMRVTESASASPIRPITSAMSAAPNATIQAIATPRSISS